MTQKSGIALLFSLLLLLPACGPRLAAPEPTVDDRMVEARTSFEAGRFYDAKLKYEALRFDYPGHARIGEVQFQIALCLYKVGEFLNAEQEFRAFLREFPASHPYADDAMYWLCKSLFDMALPARLDQADTRKALEETDAFAQTYPESEFLAEVKQVRAECLDRLAEKEFLAGKLYRRMGYSSSSIHYLRLLEKEYADSRWIVRGRYEWARSLYDQKDYAAARLMADTCRIKLTELMEKEKDRFVLNKTHGKVYRFFHLFGVIPYETRSPVKIYIDELESDLQYLDRRITKRLASQPAAKPAPAGS